MMTTTAPGLFDIRLSPSELSDPDVRRRIARNNYSTWGFQSVAESQEFIDSVAALADGEPVSAAFKARSDAEAADRRRAAEAAVAATRAWGEQQRFNAAVSKRDRADQRVRNCRGNLDYWLSVAGQLQAPDFGQPVDHAHGAGWADATLNVAYLINHIEKIEIPKYTEELAEAQKAVEQLQVAPKATAKPAKS